MNFEFQIKTLKKFVKTQEEIDKEIVIYVFQEKTNPEIAEITGYSMGYIKQRLKYLFKIYGVKSKVGLVREILKMGKISSVN